jgi:hypothetical protein
MLPPQSPPVIRLKGTLPTVFDIAYQPVTKPNPVHAGETETENDVVTGADPTPNSPQRFQSPISCNQDCAILGGPSFVQCMLRCR